LPRAVRRIAAPWRAPAAQHAEDAHVVLDRRDTRAGTVADHGLERLDIAIALGTVGQHDRRMPLAIDVAGGQEWRTEAVNADAVLLAEIAQTLQFFDGCVDTIADNLRIAANVTHAVAREVLEMLLIARRALA